MMYLFLLIPLLGNAYVLWHIYRILPLPGWLSATVCTLLFCTFLCLIAFYALDAAERLPMPQATALYETGTSALIVLLYLAMLFLVLDAGRLLHIVPASFLRDSWRGTLFVTLLIGGTFLYGNLHYRDKHRQPLALTTGKEMKRPLRIVLMSDLHLGFHNRRAELARWVDMVNAERPDVVLIAGDIIDVSVRPLLEEGSAEEFRRLTAPVYACLGNHEYYATEPRAEQFYADAGIRLLRDEFVYLGNDLCIVGRDDRTNLRRKPLDRIMREVNRNRYIILLDHQPYNLEQAENCDVDFQFSGHTHHGQVWPISWITDRIYECAFGMHQRGSTRYYVTSGIGIWGGKFRIGTRSEYVVATIGA
ncbi:MAG: metallophosphoesterase [Alloprevotella sp.]|nr:metallophosphoesterase [Alloprevotella sp.]